LALAVPLSRFTSRVGGGSAFYVMPKTKLITHYGQFWERTKMFTVKNGRVNTNDLTWPGMKKPPIAGRGIYILYRGTTPVYVGLGTARFGIWKRLQSHTKGWLAYAWDNASWYKFKDDASKEQIEAVEALLVATIPGLLNGAQPSSQLGTKCFPGKGKTDASNTLWKKNADDDTKA